MKITYTRMISTITNPGFLTLLAVFIIIFGVNLLVPTSLPDDPYLQFQALSAAQKYPEAEQTLQTLLQHRPLDIDLNHEYLVNHFKFSNNASGSEGSPPTSDALLQHYNALINNPATANLGYYGLGMIQAAQKNYTRALTHYRKISDPNQKYVNAAIGYAYWQLGNFPRAEQAFHREISLTNGDLQGATRDLATMYIENHRLEDTRKLLSDPTTRPFVSTSIQRKLAFHSGDLSAYLPLIFVAPLRSIQPLAGLCALIIALTWLIYLRRVSVFRPLSLTILVAGMALGMLFTLISLIMSDALNAAKVFADHSLPWIGFAYHIVNVGIVEEIVKLAPVVLLVIFYRRPQEPFELVAWGCASALGFATLENALYFSHLGLDITFYRFLFSTVMHLAMTSIVVYAWAQARFARRSNQLLAILGGLLLAAFLHGVYDYFLSAPVLVLRLLGAIAIYLMMRELYRILINTQNCSPLFPESGFYSPRLDNAGLLVSSGAALLLITYLYQNFQLTTQAANQNLLSVGAISLPILFGLAVSLGRLRLARLALKPALPTAATKIAAYLVTNKTDNRPLEAS